MASLENRVERLEAASGTTRGAQDASVKHEALDRMTNEELDAYEGAVVRYEAGESPTAADREIVARAWELYEEAAREHAQKA